MQHSARMGRARNTDPGPLLRSIATLSFSPARTKDISLTPIASNSLP